MIVNLQDGQSQKVFNAIRQERCAFILVDEFDVKNRDRDAYKFDQASFINGKGFCQTMLGVIKGLEEMLEAMMV
jgi:hypothetical protein